MSLPKHALVAQTLMGEIEGGRLKVGEKLPSEPELARLFGVSRHTVRVALGELQARRLVQSRQGHGTVVAARKAERHFVQSFDSDADLLQYALKTQVRILDRTTVRADETLAATLRCKPGEAWWLLKTLRFSVSPQRPVALSDVWVPLAMTPLLDELGRTREPLFRLIEQRLGLKVASITQQITAVSLDADEAQWLAAPVGSAAVAVTREYLGEAGQLLERVRVLHPGDRYAYTMHIDVHHDAGSHHE